jgi:GH15 family glucan-1,4-alpha-glucosidase
MRSLITLKALTYSPTGGIVAAVTTSLPERLGGERNWDYRFCWVRDATFTLYALLASGYKTEAQAWRDWLHRAVAGEPSRLQILYSLTGERRLAEQELPWLRGYADSSPVRVGNAAHTQCQLDTYGELMDVLHVARRDGIDVDENAWQLQRQVTDFLESAWSEPDSSLWEMRGPRRHFTHFKMMAWVAVDRAIKAVECGVNAVPASTALQGSDSRDRQNGSSTERGWSPTAGEEMQWPWVSRKLIVQSAVSQPSLP